MAAYGGQGRAQLVAGVGGEAPLAGKDLLPTGESGFESSQKAVYRGGEPADLVFGVRHRQPLREVTLGHLPGGANDGIDWLQGRPRQEVGAADREEEGYADASGETSLNNLYGLFGGRVRFPGFDYQRATIGGTDRHGVDVVRGLSGELGRTRSGLSGVG